MKSINNLKQIRLDGKVIDESMTMAQIISLGWSPSKIVELNWEVEGKIVKIKFPYGVCCKLTPNRKSIAALVENNSSNASLILLDENGKERKKIDDELIIDNKKEKGTFLWFEEAKNKLNECFGVIFQLDKNQFMVHLDIDINTGKIIDKYNIR